MADKKIISIFLIIFIIVAGIGAVFLLKKNISPLDLNENDLLKNKNSQMVNEISGDGIVEVEGINENDHYLGSFDAPAELIVYCDYTDDFCADLHDTAEKVRDNFGEKMVIIYRNFLVVNDNTSWQSALSAECAGEQGKFWEAYDLLYYLNKNNKLSRENIGLEFEKLEINKDQYENCLLSERYKDKIVRQIEEAKKYGVIGAPTLFVNKKILPGAYPFEDFTDSAGQSRQGLESIINKYLE